MNANLGLRKNFLFLPKYNETSSLYKHCIHYAKNGKIVLIMTAAADFLPLFMKECVSKEELKRLVIIHIDNIDGYTQKLLELHDWSWLPSLIVIDMRAIFTKQQNEIDVIQQNLNLTDKIHSASHNVLKQLALIVSSLFGLREVFQKRHLTNCVKSTENYDESNSVFSILIMNEDPEHISRKDIELLINLYYYKNNAFDIAEELMEALVDGG